MATPPPVPPQMIAEPAASAVPTPEPVPSPTTAKPSVPATTGRNNKYRINDDN